MEKHIFEKVKNFMTKEELDKLGNIFCPCQKCTYLNYSEEEQNTMKPKPDHICLKYNVRLKHGAFHPKLIRCEECLKDERMEA
jgi:hypothetical protein